MDFLEFAKNRFSVRKFTQEPVKQEHIEKILDAAMVAPTGCNLQPQRILVINTPTTLEKLKNCTRCHFDCTTAFLVCCNTKESWVRKYDGATSGIIDTSIVATHMMLEAQNLGVGCTWVMHFNPEAMREEFNIPSCLEPVALLVMGYPADDAAPLDMHFKSKEKQEFVFYNEF